MPGCSLNGYMYVDILYRSSGWVVLETNDLEQFQFQPLKFLTVTFGITIKMLDRLLNLNIRCCRSLPNVKKIGLLLPEKAQRA